MKIDKKTLLQYIVLALMVVGVAYYYFFYAPIEKRIAEYETEKTAKEQELQEKQLQAVKERSLDDQILAANKSIKEMDKSIFVDLSQPEALVILSELNKKGRLVFDSVTFTENSGSGEESDFNDVELRLEYTGDYYDIMSFMRSVRKYEKNISMLNANFEVSKFQAIADLEAEYADREAVASYIEMSTVRKDPEEGFDDEMEDEEGSGEESGDEKELPSFPKIANLIASMTLRYTSVPRLAELGWKDREMIKKIQSKRELAKGPFNVYSEYLDTVRARKEAERREKEIQKQSNVIREIEKQVDEDKGEDKDNEEPKNLRVLRYSFEDSGYFFVGSDKKMDGEIVNSVVKTNGVYSADFKFDYLFLRPVNVASLVFTSPQMMYSPAESLVLQVYSYEFSGHEVGIMIKDSMRKEHKVVFSPSVDWVGWKELVAELPQEIAYPCLIQRIYVEGKGREQKRMGRFLFDQLELEYAVEEKEES